MEDIHKEIDNALIERLSPSFSLLIVTATDIEEEVLHQHLKPLKGQDKLIRVVKSKSTYYLGEFGAFPVVHVSCREMGSSGRTASIVTTIDAINLWHPKAVLMIGIAFGADKKKQPIGSVLVAERVVNYEPRRVGLNDEVLRGKEGPASSLLVDRFKSVKGWNHEVEDGRIAKIFTGLVVSGEKLIDNPELKAKVLKEYPTAIGGEMEGAGIYAACDQKVNDWILVKGVCDYADGKKGKNKDYNQRLAIISAVSLSEHVFSSISGFKDIGILVPAHPIDIDDMVSELQTVDGIPKWMKIHAQSLKNEISHED